MQLTRDILDRHKDLHKHFEYYYTIIEKIENNVTKNPDISIESSKSLLEGVSKTVALRLNNSVAETRVNKMEVQAIVKMACDCIDEKIGLELEFPRRAASLVQRMGELRNSRGDISHGKAAPKKYTSDVETAKMVMRVTDCILTYILTAFFAIDLSYKEEIKYEDNPEYNAFLDESYYLEGIVYSQALYDQDYDAYEEQLRDYLDNLEEME